MFNALQGIDVGEYSPYFEYVEIDSDSREILGKYMKKVPLKWCINMKKQIAFLDHHSLTPGTIRLEDGVWFHEFRFVLQDGYGYIRFYGKSDSIDDMGPFIRPELRWEGPASSCSITLAELLSLLKNAMKVYEDGFHLDCTISRKTDDLESLKRTPRKILHGKFSQELQKLFDSVTEIKNIEIKFRNLCLNHFIHWNVEKQGLSGFYLHDDIESLFIYDVVLWSYLHISSSLEQLKQNWKNIINEKNRYKNKFSDEYLEHFCFGGAERFFFEIYFSKRIEEGNLTIIDDKIQMSKEHEKMIIEQLSNL